MQQLKLGFKHTINWDKYHSKTEPPNVSNPSLDFLNYPSFQGVSRLFLPFNANNSRIIHSRYYLPTAKVKDYQVMINGKPIKCYIKTYENIRKITTAQEDDYTTHCLLDYNYFKKHYKKIAIDLSKQQAFYADPKAIQQINFTGNLDGANNRIMLFIIEKTKETNLYLSQETVKVFGMSPHDSACVAKVFNRTACSTILFCINMLSIYLIL